MSIKRKIAILLFFMSAIIFILFIRQILLSSTPIKVDGVLHGVTCNERAVSGDKLSFSITSNSEKKYLNIYGISCFKFKGLNSKVGKKVTVLKSNVTNTVISLEVAGEVYLSQSRTRLLGGVGAFIIFCLFFIPAMILWK